MNKYLKDNLIFGDSLENAFGWITLPWGTSGKLQCQSKGQLNKRISQIKDFTYAVVTTRIAS